jgi:hypothetical protein
VRAWSPARHSGAASDSPFARLFRRLALGESVWQAHARDRFPALRLAKARMSLTLSAVVTDYHAVVSALRIADPLPP